MAENATPEQVWERVNQLYSCTNPADRTSADEWLQAHQASPGAWATLDALLKADSLPEEGAFFAANSLRAKIRRRDLKQLEAEQRERLRASLMEYIFKFRHGPLVVRKQLCLAFSEYSSQHDIGKADIVQEVCTSMSQSQETIPVLLELLLLLGEEADHVQERYAGLNAEDLHPLVVSAKQSALGVLNFLHQCFTTSAAETDPAARSKACKPIIATFCRWLRFGAVSPDELVQSPIVHAALQALGDPELCEPASDLVCELAYVSRDLSTGSAVFQLLTSHLASFYRMYQASVQKQDENLARAIARIVTEMGESYCDIVSQASPDAVNMVKLLVEVAAHPEQRIACLTYSFWWRLCSTLKNCDDATRAQRLTALQEPLMQLVGVLAVSAAFPEEADEWDQQSEDEFKNFRMESLYDAMLDLCEMLGGSVCFECVSQHLHTHLAACASDRDRWRQVEGCIFFVRACCRYLGPQEQSSVPQLLALHDKLPDQWRVRVSYTICVGRLGRWLNENPAQLTAVLQYVVTGLGLPRVGTAAAEALQDLCELCPAHLAAPAQLQGLLQIYSNMGSLTAAEQEKIIEGMGNVLCRVPSHDLPGMISAVSDPPAQQALAALGGGDKGGLVGSLKKLRMLIKGAVSACDRLANDGVAQQMDAHRAALAQAWAGAFANLWPVLESAMQQHGTDEDVMEELMRCVKNAMQAMGDCFRDFLGPFASAAVNSFMQHPLSCVLYAVTTLVSVFGRDAQYQQPLADMCATLGQKTFQILSDGSAFTQKPDIVTEFFELVGRGLRRFPRIILSAPLADTTFACGCAALHTDLAHRESLQAILSFFECLASADANSKDPPALAQDRALAAEFLCAQGAGVGGGPPAQRGKTLVHALLVAVTTKPSVCIEHVAGTCLALSRLVPQQLGGWITEGLHTLPADIMPEARQRFLDEMGAAQDLRAAKQAARGLYRAAKPP